MCQEDCQKNLAGFNAKVEGIIRIQQLIDLVNQKSNENHDQKDFVCTQTTTQSLARMIKIRNLKIIVGQHLFVHYIQNSKDNGRTIYDVYVSGNNGLGKLQAKFLNRHPKLLIKFLNHNYGFSITQKQLR